MTYIVFILSTMFVVGFLGFSSKPSPIYGGVGLIVSGSVGCGIFMSFNGSFLCLMVFLIYLGGMMVVFGYTMAMAMELYLEVWVSNKGLVVGFVMELMLVFYVLGEEYGGMMFEFSDLGDWVVYDVEDFGFVSNEAVGVSSLYSYGTWLVVVTGWPLLIGVIIIMEITRGS